MRTELKKTLCFPNLKTKKIIENYLFLYSEIFNISPSSEIISVLLEHILPTDSKRREWAITLLSDCETGLSSCLEEIYQKFSLCAPLEKELTFAKKIFDFSSTRFCEYGACAPNYQNESGEFFQIFRLLVDALCAEENINDLDAFEEFPISINKKLFLLKFNYQNAKNADAEDFFRAKDYLIDLFQLIDSYWEVLKKNCLVYRLLACITRIQKFVNLNENSLKLLELLNEN